ncbi:MAG: IS630 family transposase, partial [Xenococcus sp. MO_188.B8]|nr:IS630 family transposase [Xenococcus sp. MO_188.B8]MDJ0904291.1 IS630 family transposase [Xenococcus sp. MO_188.B8]
EHLWKFMKYHWIEINAYRCWNSLVEYVERVLREFGDKYIINFV